MTTKTCNHCQQAKPIEDFHLRKTGAPVHICKRCATNRRRKYRNGNQLKAARATAKQVVSSFDYIRSLRSKLDMSCLTNLGLAHLNKTDSKMKDASALIDDDFDLEAVVQHRHRRHALMALKKVEERMLLLFQSKHLYRDPLDPPALTRED